MIRDSMHAICSQNINKTKKFNYTAANEPSYWGKVCGFIFFVLLGKTEKKLFNITKSRKEIRQMMMVCAGG
jgi:hypothetical protein